MPRKTPILLRRGALSDRIFAITRYTRAGGLITASEKFDVTDEFEHLVMDCLVNGFNPTKLHEGNGEGEPIGLDVPQIVGEEVA